MSYFVPTPPAISAYQPGDVGFCHSAGVIGRGIRIIEWLRRDWGGQRESAGDNWNHVFIIDKWDAEANDWTIIQAVAAGVTDTAYLSTVAPGGSYTIIPCPDGVNRDKVLEFARAQVGYKYGFVTDGCILLTLFSPHFFNIMLSGTWICSALGAESLRAGGWLHNWGDIYQVSPAQLYIALKG